MKKSRRKFKPEFKAQVALAAIQERETLSDLSKRYKVHPVQITKWKKEFLQNASAAFEKDAVDKDGEAEKQRLYAKIGQLEVERDWLKNHGDTDEPRQSEVRSEVGERARTSVAVMVLGALASCFGLRWAAGLAGGAGLAVVGWAGLVIGLAELPIAVAESITRTSSESFTLRVTRDLGWWLAAVVGILGLLVFIAALRLAGSGGRRALNPIVAALTALAIVILAAGPLVPVGIAVFADNFRSTDPERDLPTAFFAGRLGQVALIAFAGVAGMLIVRSFGLGFAAGGVSVATWMWASSLAELGDNPVGIAVSNPGSSTTVPHAVTNVGMVATIVLLLVAAVMAAWRLTRGVAPPHPTG